MDWAPFWTIIATGAVTIGGVVVKGWFDGRADRRRIAAEDKRASDADERERRNAEAASISAARDAETQAGRSALSLFAEMLNAVQKYPAGVEASAIQDAWQRNQDAPARLAIETVGDDDIRAAMNSAVDALTNFGPYTNANSLARSGTWNAEWLIKLMISLAGCVVRGVTLDERLREQISVVEGRLNEMRDQYES